MTKRPSDDPTPLNSAVDLGGVLPVGPETGTVEVGANGSAPAIVQPRGRIAYVDAVRGMAILSMLTLHLAEPALLTRLTHELLVIDGSHGFVLLAGFVLGLVERRRAARGSPLSSTRRATVKRIGLLILAHWFLVAVVVLGDAIAGSTSLLRPDYANEPIVRQVIGMLTFREMPDNVNILPMYVIFLMLVGFVYAPLMRAGKTWIVIAISLTLYAASHIGHGFLWILAPFAAFAWQALFSSGFVIGWHFEAVARLRRRTHPWSLVAACVLVLIPALLARRRVRELLNGGIGEAVDGLIDKFQLGGLNLLGGLGLVLVLAVLVGGLQSRTMLPRASAWLAMLGRRSLPCYITISVLAWVTHLLPDQTRRLGPGDILILVGIAITTVVAWIRDTGFPPVRRRS